MYNGRKNKGSVKFDYTPEITPIWIVIVKNIVDIGLILTLCIVSVLIVIGIFTLLPQLW